MARNAEKPAGKQAAKPDGKRRSGRVAVRLGDKDTLPAQTWHGPAAKKPRRTTKRSQKVRKRILDAALECFGAFGFEGTSTRAVADRADVTHTLVLYHFQSKDQLWIETMDAALRAYTQEMDAHLENSGNDGAGAALRTFIEQFIRMSARQPQIHRILTMASNQGTTRLAWVIDNFLRDHFGKVCDIIRAAQKEGAVRQCDPARLYYLIIGACGTPFTISTEYRALTGRNVFSETEIMRNIAFLYELVFVEAP